ncbi:DUF4245 domain-containing protein [Corynebacterium sp. 13CS0277]|uniref:DUF4245 domain-containing protein n=1 Tax=Corynebacterium sp. 13CS0277 TaxID=2071994 RepID=UPI000D044B9F|nr:DUF4245 domain-containing protein [Corynebacterium sp. 13CS0277]PRQ12252.1 DUF4245 domain-containing protein [Corynebacterium sp. 13CS0277]
MSESKPRLFQDARDIGMSLFVILIVMVLAVGFTGMCSFSRTDKEFAPVQTVDAEKVLSLEARAMDFPVRFPATPEGWSTINARRTMLNNTPAVVVGYLTDDKGYAQVLQTNQPVDVVAKDYFDQPRTQDGSMTIDGVEFLHFPPTEDGDDLWVGDLGEARLAVSGVADNATFFEIAGRFVDAAPLPHDDASAAR